MISFDQGLNCSKWNCCPGRSFSYECTIRDRRCRSDAKFVKEAKEAGFENLKGHRTVGGMRASIYNAMPYEGVVALVDFMKKFEEENL